MSWESAQSGIGRALRISSDRKSKTGFKWQSDADAGCDNARHNYAFCNLRAANTQAAVLICRKATPLCMLMATGRRLPAVAASICSPSAQRTGGPVGVFPSREAGACVSKLESRATRHHPPGCVPCHATTTSATSRWRTRCSIRRRTSLWQKAGSS